MDLSLSRANGRAYSAVSRILPLLSIRALERLVLACHDSSLSSIYILDNDTARCPTNEDGVSWLMLWLLTCFNKKHCFSKCGIVDISKIGNTLRNFRNRLKWRWFFRNNDDEGGSSFHQLKPKGLPVPECGHPMPANIEAVANELSKFVHNEVVSMNKRKFPANPEWQILKWALRSLKSRDLVPLQTDKDGGWCLMTRERFLAEEFKIISNGDYRRCFPLDVQSLAREYVAICKHAAGDDNNLFRSLLSSWHDPRALAYSTLKLNAKTHKYPVKFRNIHAAPFSQFNSLSKWVSRILDGYIYKHTHMLKDSAQLVKLLEGAVVPAGSIFIAGDISHFFMTGDSIDLASSASGIIDDDLTLKTKVRDVVFYLLENQYIVLGSCSKDQHSNNMYKVQKGSGMGLSHSSSVSEAAFLHKAELPLLKESILENHGIKGFFRFKDDFLVIGGPSREKAKEFFRALIHRATPFVVECTDVSSKSVDFLEVVIHIECGKIFCTNRTKATKLPVPFLAVDSDHHPRTLRSWPVCYAQRKCSLCTFEMDSESELSRVVNHFSLQNFPKHIIDKLISLRGNWHTKRKHVEPNHIRNQIWLVLPYAPAFVCSNFESKFKAFVQQPWMRQALDWGGLSFDISISWANGSKSLVKYVRQV